MLNAEAIGFIRDYILIVQEKYNGSLRAVEGETEADKAFRVGKNLAYYDCLDILEQQLEAFGYGTEPFGTISPTYGVPVPL